MTIKRFTSIGDLQKDPMHGAFNAFLARTEQAHFFQSPEFLALIGPVKGYSPVLFLACDADGRVIGSVLGTYQRDGSALKSWFSRRLIVWGGPVGDPITADALLEALIRNAKGRAIFMEFRNFQDTAHYREAFDHHGFTYLPHLNFLLELGEEESVLKRMSSNRRRQVRSSIAAGATFGEAESDAEVIALYELLASLYKEKVGKPLPDPSLFLQLQHSPDGRVFVIRHNGRVIGGSAGPAYRNGTLFQWYVCGDQSVPGIHASVLASWAQITHGIKHGYRQLDFMGAGRPGQGYGVHEFKAKFGGTEVCYGRYEKILAPHLYQVGVLGLRVMHGMTRSKKK